MQFVFRNQTIERFFGKDYAFSGYDDISVIPDEAEGYVWFYQIPVKCDHGVLASEVNTYLQKLNLVLPQINESKTVITMTLEPLFEMTLTDRDYRLRKAISEYNLALYSMGEQYANVKVVDFGEFLRRYPSSELMDWKFYFISQMGISPKLTKDFQAWWQQKMDSIALKRKKCIVLDLDNTLWGGVLGEDGISGIKIGGDYPGKAFLFFQESLLELSKTGVILTVCSKNTEQDVLEVWEKNPFMVLRKEHFAAWRINWKDKATNILDLAEELNIGMDSMVFVDDSPTERELIRQVLPMVEVPDFPVQPYKLPVFFKQLVETYFKVYSVTGEDAGKTAQYHANALRIQNQRKFVSHAEFVNSLGIQITIEEANEFNIPRIAQMTQKTNQFNLTTRRYTDADVRRFLEMGWRVWCLSVADRFGNQGITGCVMVEECRIDTLLLSCRILGLGIEFAFVKTVLRLLKEAGYDKLKAEYVPTTKNAQVSDFYDRCGFSLISENNGTKQYDVSLADSDLTIEEAYHMIIQ